MSTPRTAAPLAFALVSLASACAAPAAGSLDLCLPTEMQPGPDGSDASLTVRGRFVDRAAPSSGCGGGLTVRDDNGDEHAFGVNLQRPDMSLVDWTLPLDIGDTVEVHARLRQPFGSVEGMVLRDAEGALLAAFDEGTWGGALDADDLAFAVERGEQFDALRKDCITRTFHTLVFQGDDDKVSLEPFAQAPITVEGAELRAVAVRAEGAEAGRGCSVTDTTGTFAWALVP